ncbi:hypothetical protein [Streptomyces sp. PSKA30]|uniref:hypothetical protein n=1 Tax=Streptomyces sp. PSKA30 TaxID=2874597 RepID=UPI001CD17C57|nr:hypothetical protein [Streptomyces sp. PSKA30]MBZ9644545.1 hypothetical protein [Streptomyces sp. PSKA30]
MTTEPEPVAGHTECHDESTCPLTLLFGHPVFLKAYLEGTAEDNWPPEKLAELVLALLETGPLAVTDDIRARVNACSDPDQLRTWAGRAMRVNDPEDLFAEDAS